MSTKKKMQKKQPSFSIQAIFLIVIASLLMPPIDYLSAADDRPLPVLDSGFTQTSDPQVETVADSLEYNRNTNKVIARGNVLISYQDQKITADYAEVDTTTRLAHAKGHVIIFKNDQAAARGDEVEYNFNDASGVFPDGTVLAYPWKCQGEKLEKVDANTFRATNATATTCKGDKPPYELRAKSFTIHKDDKLIAKNVTIYSLGKPIFWWPYLILPLQYKSLPFALNAGHSTEYGTYIETTKGFSVTENIWGQLHADWRSRRGFGTGADLTYDYGAYANGEFRGYWTQDKHAPTPGSPNPYDNLEDRDRGRFSWWHRTDFDEYTNIQLRYHRLADEYFLQDFFEKEHRGEIEPQSFVTLTKNSENYGSYVYLTKEMNGFERIVERLPEIRLNWKNQPFLNSDKIYYENETSYANLNKEFGRQAFNQTNNRFDHFSQWYVPLEYAGWNVMPFWNMRTTYYTRDAQSDEDHLRFVGGFGFDVRNHYYRVYDTEFDKFGIEVNHIRHVVEPYVTYEAFRSTLSDEKLTTFDNIDKIDDQDLITFGVENRLQTKRVVGGRVQRVDIVSLNTYLGLSPNPHNEAHGSSFTVVGQEFIVRPYNWLQYRLEYEYDFLQSRTRFFNQDLAAHAGGFKIILGHRYIANDIERNFGRAQVERQDGESNELVADISYEINRLWSVRGYLRADASGDGIQEWQVSASRDMDCLILDFGYNVRDSDINSNNQEIFFNLRLADYSTIAIRSGSARGTFSEPRIGETVTGANQSSSSFQTEAVH